MAQKNLEENLVEKCINYLSHNINGNNFYKILDFAFQENLGYLENWCLKFFQDNLNLNTVTEMIKYLDRHGDSENKKFRKQVFNFIIARFFKIETNTNRSMQVYEDFLLENIGTHTISALVRFLSLSYEYEKFDPENIFYEFQRNEENPLFPTNLESYKNEMLNPSTSPKTKDLFDERTRKLKEAAYCFIQANLKAVLTTEVLKDFPNKSKFLREFTQYSVENASKQLHESIMKVNSAEMSEEKIKENGKKRMEPVQDGAGEENPILKKSKNI